MTWRIKPINYLLLVSLFLLSTAAGTGAAGPGGEFFTRARAQSSSPDGESTIYLPVIEKGLPDMSVDRPVAVGKRRVNAPYFSGDVIFAETAVFWFGEVSPDTNYTDVRVGFSDTELYVYVLNFDRFLWYDTQPDPAQFEEWDSVSLYLSTDGQVGDGLGGNTYRFDGQLNHWEERQSYQNAYQGQSGSWQLADVDFTTRTDWRGNAPNTEEADAGWGVEFRVPFESLGFTSAPENGEIWGLGVKVHDRDAESGAAFPGQYWPESFDGQTPASWGELSFGLPAPRPASITEQGSVIIRHKKDGMTVTDGEVGGGSVCGDGLNRWTEWGNTSYPGSEENADFNIQNQADIADWVCFSKFYISFPLDSVPSGKQIVSARLTLHQMGSSGGGDWDEAQPSWIQVFTMREGWDEATLTWNNAPLAVENVSGAWVDPMMDFPGWPGIRWEWDVTRAVAGAYAEGGLLNLALYSADSEYHSGKYFVSSDTADWNAGGRPALEITWGE